MKRLLPPTKNMFNIFLCFNLEINIIIQNYLRKNETIPLYIRQKGIFILYKHYKRFNRAKLMYICIYTAKAKSVNTNFKISNLIFKALMKKGSFNGYIL